MPAINPATLKEAGKFLKKHGGKIITAGNGGVVAAYGNPMHDLPASAAITIPANGLLVFCP